MPPRLGEDRHPEPEHARHALLDRDVADLATLVVLENPYARRLATLDDRAKALGALLDVNRRLGAQKALLGHGGHDAGRRGRVPDMRSANDHVVEISTYR